MKSSRKFQFHHHSENASLRSHLFIVWFFIGVVGLLCFSGCGRQTYRERVEETSRYYRRLENRDRFLKNPPWKKNAVSIRIPFRFRFMSDEDDRPMQPEFFAIDGFLASWVTRITTGTGTSWKDGFLCVMQNDNKENSHPQDEQKPPATQDTISELAKLFSVEENVVRESKSRTYFPLEEGVIDRVEYSSYEFDIPTPSKGLDGSYKARVYLRETRFYRVAILVLLPDDLPEAEKKTFENAVALSLETLEVLE